MPATIKTNSIKPLSEQAYLKNGSARKLAIYKVYITKGWEQTGLVQVLVSRQHVTGNLTGALYLIDLWCKGVSNSFHFFNEAEDFMVQLLARFSVGDQLIACTYELAHNVIFNAIEYAEDLGFKPDDSFKLTSFVLEPDTDKIEFIDVPCGRNGRPVFQADFIDAKTRAALKLLEKNVGKGNFDLIIKNSDPGESFSAEQPAGKKSADFLTWSVQDWNELIESGSLKDLQENMELPAYIYHRTVLVPQAIERGIDLDAIRSQLNWGLTYAPTLSIAGYQAKPAEEEEIQALHSLLYSKKNIDKALMSRIKSAIIRYPENPVFHNYQYNALLATGKKTEAEALVNIMVQLFPDYLFGKIALAHLYKQQNQIKKIPEAFNNKFDLHSLYPDRASFHVSECINFYSLLCLYYLEIKENLLAEVYAAVIREWQTNTIPEFTADVLGLCDVNMLKQVAIRLAQASESSKNQQDFISLLM